MVQIRRTLNYLILLGLSLTHAVAQVKPTENTTGQKPILYQPSILIEMFSSEGCSSCPVADEFMGELIHMSDSVGLAVYVIDFHVDIWNRSGWVDPYSDSNYTKRQQTYLKKKSIQSTYTPMAFINGGDKDFAGSDKPGIGRTLHALINTPSQHFLRTAVGPVEGQDSMQLTYQAWGNIDSCDLRVAFIQKRINNMVMGGENSGLVLHHHNIVRNFYTLPTDGKDKGTIKIGYNPDFNMENFAVISYLQHQRTWKVLAADRITFTTK